VIELKKAPVAIIIKAKYPFLKSLPNKDNISFPKKKINSRNTVEIE
jgi:hypothetical protein